MVILLVCMGFYLSSSCTVLIVYRLFLRESFNVNWSKSSWGGRQGGSSLPIQTGAVCLWSPLSTHCIYHSCGSHFFSSTAITPVSCSSCSRSRERYRERDGGRAQQEAGSLRSCSRGHEGGSAQAPAPAGGTPVVLAGSRSYSGGNLPILQPRDCAAADEDTAWTEGSRDSGDASSIGDPEFDGLRPQGPRGGGKPSSRQVLERRERDGSGAGTGRREGKWERKQHS